MLIVFRPYFPKCGDFLESLPSVNASGVMTYFQLIVEIVHTLSLDCGMTETGGERGMMGIETCWTGQEALTYTFSVSDQAFVKSVDQS